MIQISYLFCFLYWSFKWQDMQTYIKQKNGIEPGSSSSREPMALCERCIKKGKVKPGKIVHHKKWLTDENKQDWDIAYNPKNLEYVCNDCHEEEHDRSIGLQKFLTPPRGCKMLINSGLPSIEDFISLEASLT